MALITVPGCGRLAYSPTRGIVGLFIVKLLLGGVGQISGGLVGGPF